MAGNRAVARGFARRPWKRLLIGLEITLAVVLLVLSGLLMRTVISLNAINPGFVPENVVTFGVALPAADYPTIERVGAFVDQVLTRLSETTGVERAAVASAAPIGAAAPAVVLPVEEAGPSPRYRPTMLHSISEGYVAALRIPLYAGRFIELSDHASAPRVGVVNETLARALWVDGNAIGRQILQLGVAGPITIVGVIGDVRQSGLQSPAQPALYVPMAQSAVAIRNVTFITRSRDGLRFREENARALIQRADSALPLHTLRTGEELIGASIAGPRFNLLVLAVFASLALALAWSGIYGVLAQSVQDAQREFGIRQALGATTAGIVRMVLSAVLPPTIGGVIAGSAASAAGGSLASALLFGVRPNDPATYIAASMVVLGLSVLAAARPAYRAARGELMLLLRYE
jgi:putative ABC transport system permease protein